MKVSIQIIEVYEFDVDAKTVSDAIEKAYAMGTLDIKRVGKLTGIYTDYAEVDEFEE